MTEASRNSGRLAFSSDEEPGLRRVRRGRGFSYHSPDGEAVRDPDTLARIRSLAIPPAYGNVWICVDPQGHVQATGRDARGRKQYRYHPEYRAAQDSEKFERMARFGELLPGIRERIAKDMRARSTRLNCVLATIVHLLDSTAIRIGNASYAQQNGSFGLTTLRRRHVDLAASTIRFRFKGKSGKKWDLSVRDRRVARVIRGLQELPGQDLFRYLDQDEIKPVRSEDINRYLREIGEESFSAKDFRTWHGTVLAAVALAQQRQADPTVAPKRAIRQAMIEVSAALQNTPTVCRNSYVHPALIDAFEDDHPLFSEIVLPHELPHVAPYIAAAEQQLLAFLASESGENVKRKSANKR